MTMEEECWVGSPAELRALVGKGFVPLAFLKKYAITKIKGMPTPNPTPRPILSPSDKPLEVEGVVFDVLEVVVMVLTVAGRAEEAARSSSVEENPSDSAKPAACTARVKEPSESFFATRASMAVCKSETLVVAAKFLREVVVTRNEKE